MRARGMCPGRGCVWGALGGDDILLDVRRGSSRSQEMREDGLDGLAFAPLSTAIFFYYYYYGQKQVTLNSPA